MSFTHIHCSSRFDRSAEALENDLDNWMARSDLITMTEVGNNGHAARLAEKDWNYFNSKQGGGRDNCAIAWDTTVWSKVKTHLIQLENVRWYTVGHHVSPHLYAATVLLRNRATDERLLCAVCHLPAHVQGKGAFSNIRNEPAAEWRARKMAYTTAMKTWSSSTETQIKNMKPDGILVVADFNMNLKDAWVRAYLRDHWEHLGLQLAWRDFSSLGTSINGGNRVIDGSLYGKMKLDTKPDIMAAVRSSDHRPFIESFELGQSDEADWNASGSQPGDPWWGFGDYQIDEIFTENVATGERGGEVL